GILSFLPHLARPIDADQISPRESKSCCCWRRPATSVVHLLTAPPSNWSRPSAPSICYREPRPALSSKHLLPGAKASPSVICSIQDGEASPSQLVLRFSSRRRPRRRAPYPSRPGGFGFHGSAFCTKCSALHKKVPQMDRSWISARLFSKAHLDGVNEFMTCPAIYEKCAKNKSNREKVVMQQRTGSRCFVAHCHAVADMEAMMTEPPEGQDLKSPNEIFSEVLPRSKFLQTAGIVAAAPKRNGKTAVSSRVQELDSELEAEKRGAEALRDQLDAQQLEMGDLKKRVQDSDAQMEALKQQAAETNIILRKLLMLNKV
ncbi:hypothetical protein EJB05_49938, partial [Eragrostis curvula]